MCNTAIVVRDLMSEVTGGPSTAGSEVEIQCFLPKGTKIEVTTGDTGYCAGMAVNKDVYLVKAPSSRMMRKDVQVEVAIKAFGHKGNDLYSAKELGLEDKAGKENFSWFQ